MIVLVNKIVKGQPETYQQNNFNIIHPITGKPVQKGDKVITSVSTREWEVMQKMFKGEYVKIDEISETRANAPKVEITLIEPDFDNTEEDEVFSLERTASKIINDINNEFEVDFLQEIKEAETNGQNRAGIIKAIDKRIAKLS